MMPLFYSDLDLEIARKCVQQRAFLFKWVGQPVVCLSDQ